jgi:hypothetical protein
MPTQTQIRILSQVLRMFKVRKLSSASLHCFIFLVRVVKLISLEYFGQHITIFGKSKVYIYIWLKWIRIRMDPQALDADPTGNFCSCVANN